jgi:hypothetical protein
LPTEAGLLGRPGRDVAPSTHPLGERHLKIASCASSAAHPPSGRGTWGWGGEGPPSVGRKVRRVRSDLTQTSRPPGPPRALWTGVHEGQASFASESPRYSTRPYSTNRSGALGARTDRMLRLARVGNKKQKTRSLTNSSAPGPPTASDRASFDLAFGPRHCLCRVWENPHWEASTYIWPQTL